MTTTSTPLIQNVGSPPKRRRAASSSSLALAPLDQLLEIDADGVRSTIRALRGIERQQAAIGDHVRREDVHADCSEDISRALASGSLVATVSDTGEQVLRINRSSVQWSVAFLLGRPLQLSRVSRGGDPLKLCKLDVLVRLHADGWRPRPNLAGAWEPGMALEYTAGLKQPLSYFAALLDQNAVFWERRHEHRALAEGWILQMPPPLGPCCPCPHARGDVRPVE